MLKFLRPTHAAASDEFPALDASVFEPLIGTEYDLWENSRTARFEEAIDALQKHQAWVRNTEVALTHYALSSSRQRQAIPAADRGLGSWLHNSNETLRLLNSEFSRLLNLHVHMHCTWSAIIEKLEQGANLEAHTLWSNEYLPLSQSIQAAFRSALGRATPAIQ